MPINRITPIFPLEGQDGEYGYVYSDDLTTVVNQNLKNILLTRRGERIFLPGFGAGLQDFLFEMPTNMLLTKLKNVISNQIRKFATYITVKDIQVSYSGEATIEVSIKYNLNGNNISGTFDTTISNILEHTA
tara:strand:+ start:216 stop:611 length:396 start_codon:yes stop_codon:yes gene_type:complete